MAALETNIVNDIMVKTSPHGVRLFKNVRGFFYTLDSVQKLIGAIKSANWKAITDAMTDLRKLKAGLMAAGSSDLIGFTPVLITEAMVGKTLPIFTSLEAKTAIGAASEEQMQWLSFVQKNGGFAGVVRSPEDAMKVMNLSTDDPQWLRV